MTKIEIIIKENKKNKENTDVTLNTPKLEKGTEKEKQMTQIIWNLIHETLKNQENNK